MTTSVTSASAVIDLSTSPCDHSSHTACSPKELDRYTIARLALRIWAAPASSGLPGAW